MALIRYFIDWLVALFTRMDYKLGVQVFNAPAPWKVSCVSATKFGLFIGVYHNNSRKDSKLYLNGAQIYKGSEETICQGLTYYDTIYFPGECGNLLIYSADKISKGSRVKWATACGVWNDTPYIFDTPKQGAGITAINCIDGLRSFKVTGKGIVTQTAVRDGYLYCAVCDGNGGLSIHPSGKLIPVPTCLCVANYNDRLLCSSGNKIMELVGDNVLTLTELPCEKIHHFMVHKGLLWAACANPDSLWVINRVNKKKCVVNFNDKTPVGGSIFRTRISAYGNNIYFGRAEDGVMAAVYTIK